MGTKESCDCADCKGDCLRAPGRFLPNEIGNAAEYLGLTPREFFQQYVVVASGSTHGLATVLVPRPAREYEEKGVYTPSLFATFDGTCIFFKNGLCSIHPVKPYECREAYHAAKRDVNEVNEEIDSAWAGNQRQVLELLEGE